MVEYFRFDVRCVFAILFCSWLLFGCSHPAGNQGSGNRLENARSPYLREHADNPVNWFEWGEEALEKARIENKPLIISIGYASCHWCHVMEEESFMDTAVARMMNENFVSIKVDREERPDIDQIYLSAAQLISGNAGWPLNAFALPDGRPFYAGTYYPNKQWRKILEQITEAYKEKNGVIIQQAAQLTKGIQTQEVITLPADTVSRYTQKMFANLFDRWQPNLDLIYGGFGDPPKFPMPATWEFLLQYNYLTDQEKALDAVVTTLDAMAQGGIYDHLGGGFSRYSTDANWKVPHFEKMLYDNGQLVSLYSHAYQKTGKPLYAEVVHQTLDFIKNEMTASGGGFYSSLNADSEGTEGKFYLWTTTEIEKLLSPELANLFKEYYQVLDSGNWDNGFNILFRNESVEAFAKGKNLPVPVWQKMLKQAQVTLVEARKRRIRPTTDDKILTGWNALMLKGYVDAYLALGSKEYLDAAIKNAVFLEKNMIRRDGGLWRNYIDGKAGIEGFLDDYALLAKAFIHLYQATFDIHWLEKARNLADYAIKHFRQKESGLFYYTSDLSENLIARKMELSDNVIPSSNSVFADVLFVLGQYYADDAYLAMSNGLVRHVYQDVNDNGRYYSNWSRLVGMMLFKPFEIAVVGETATEKSIALQKHFLPNAIFMGGTEENLPLLENKSVAGETIIYVCRNKVCKLPVKSVEEALQQLEE